jgi:drug/metabolite transporter (DMT)-like permease
MIGKPDNHRPVAFLPSPLLDARHALRGRLDSLPPRAVAFAALVVTAALWGSNAVVARGLLDSVAAVWVAALRWMIVVVLLTPFVWKERAAIALALRTQTLPLALFALIGFAPQNTLVYEGLAGTTAINMGLLNSAVPVMIVALVAARMRRAPSLLEGLGLALSVCGVLLIVAHGDPRALARLDFSSYELIVLVGMLIWAVYTIKLGERRIALSFPAFCFAAGLIGVVLVVPALGWEVAVRGWPAIDAGTAAGIIYLGALPTLAAMLLYGYGIARIGVVQAGIFTHLVPVFAALFAVLLIGEHLHAFHAAGFALVAGGAIVCCLMPSPMLSSRPDAAAGN